jgi:hypothetical protein
MKKISRTLCIVGFLSIAVVVFVSQFMYVLPLHIASFVVTIIAVIIADFHALLWMIGKYPTLPSRRMGTLHYVVSIGLLVSLTSGFLMFLPLREELLSISAFWVKMIFVLALVVNSFVISRHMHIPTTQTFASLTTGTRNVLLVSGLISSVCWAGAFFSALSLGM